MHFSTILPALFVLMGSLVSADVHPQGLCVDLVGGQYVYNDAATKAMCTSYKNRNTGNNDWDKCPDCTMVR